MSTEGGGVTAASWKWYALMDEALGTRPSVTPPVLFASSSREVTPPVSTPKRRRVDNVEIAKVIEENDRRISEAWAEMEERHRRAEEARVSEAREFAEREERRHREAVALEERRFNFLRESEERREREAAARERETAAERRETAAREGDSRQNERGSHQRGAPPHSFGKNFCTEIKPGYFRFMYMSVY